MPRKIKMSSAEAVEEMHRVEAWIRSPTSARRLWTRLTPKDRKRLGNNLEKAHTLYGTAGMWSELRGVSAERAILEVAKTVSYIDDGEFLWLLREIGEPVDVDEAISKAIAAGNFVLVESPREAYWDGKRIEVNWERNSALWEFLFELGRHSKAGRPIDNLTFGERASKDIVTKRKHRLTKLAEFPIQLSIHIECAGRGSQQLKLPREQIQVFEINGDGTLSESNP